MQNLSRSLAALALLSLGFCLLLESSDAQVSGSNSIQTTFVSVGATFTLGSGTGACTTTSTLTGGPTAGSFKCTGTAGASTQPIVLPSAPHGWVCSASDVTSGIVWAQSATSAAGCTVSGTLTTTSDVVVFSAIGY